MHTTDDNDEGTPVEPEGVPSGGDSFGTDPTANDGTADADSPSGDAGLEDLLPQSRPAEGTAPLP